MPIALSLIADMFPPQRLTVAFAVIGVAESISRAMNYMMLDFIKWFGWRNVYRGLGGIFTLVGLAMLFFIKEPKRGVFTYLQKG